MLFVKASMKAGSPFPVRAWVNYTVVIDHTLEGVVSSPRKLEIAEK
jgi:hypothetical protein